MTWCLIESKYVIFLCLLGLQFLKDIAQKTHEGILVSESFDHSVGKHASRGHYTKHSEMMRPFLDFEDQFFSEWDPRIALLAIK